MKNAEGKKQAPISMPVIVIGVLAIGAMAYFLLQPTTPAPQPEPLKPVVKVDSDVQAVNTTSPNHANVTTNSNVKSDGNLIQNSIVDDSVNFVSSQDPFKPSSLFLESKSVVETKPITPVIAQNSTPEIKPILPVNKENENREVKPVLKGIVKTTSNQVAMIYFNKKTHLLYAGDKLPGSNYLVADINKESVVLISPDNRLKLEKKEAN